MRLWPVPAGNAITSPAATVEIAALPAAEPQGGVADRDAEHLVGGRVVMMEGEDAPAPASPPIVLGEFPLEGARRILFVGLDRAAIEDRGQAAVRNAPVILEEGRLDPDRVSARQVLASRGAPLFALGLHQGDEAIEKVMAVARARRSLGMVLNRESRDGR